MKELKQKIKNYFINKNGFLLSKRFKPNNSYYQIVVDNTSFLSENCIFSERLYCFLNDIDKLLICVNNECSSKVNFVSFNYGYNKYCKKGCSAKDSKNKKIISLKQKENWKNKSKEDINKSIKKRSKTCLEKYGTENVAQNNKIKNKISNTLKEKYDSGLISSSFVDSEIQEKIRKTWLEKYGVDHVFKSDQVQGKIKQTNLDRLGVENPFSSELIKNKIKNTNLKRHGVENPQQSIKIRNKTQKTNLERYGNISPLSHPEVRKKGIRTLKEKYNVDHPMRSLSIKEKLRQTVLKKYGVNWSAQSHISPATINKLDNPEWLQYQHHNLKQTTIETSREIHVSDNVV